ncbi:hypothetical protein LUCX_330 [Xanthomonas phage vB_XciM_LucasX]|nr:hypothetical protein LUCX_330 [Xanthomonas phage vB_XciM_LucasX]
MSHEETNGLAPIKRVPDIDQIADMNEDELLAYTRKIRLRQIAYKLEANGGVLPDDLDEQKLVHVMLKDLDSQAIKQKQIGARAQESAADREAVAAVARALERLGDRPMQAPIEGTVRREAPRISDASNLQPLELKPGEASVQIEEIPFDSLFDENKK